MRSCTCLLLLLLMMTTILFSSCQTGPILPTEWNYQEKAIQIRLKADSQLNMFSGQPHTLYVCVYQLTEPNKFNQLSNDEDGLHKLLECNLFDGSVATSEQVIIRPGKDTTHTLDRAEGAKYVAIVAGYYSLDKERMIRLFDVPVVVEEEGFFTVTRQSKPATLRIDLTLGPEQIMKSKE